MFTGPNTITNGLVLSLDAANVKSYISGSTTWRDLSGNNNSGSLVNGPTFNSANGGSIVFDGVDDYVNINNMPSINLEASSFSLEAWVYNNTPDTNTWRTVIAKNRTGAGGGTILGIWRNNLGGWHFRNNQFSNTSTLATPNAWSYLCLTVNSSTTTATGYVNAVSSVSFTSTGINGTNPYLIGGWGSEYFNGNISNIKIYNRALSASEVAQNYNAQKSRFGL
jgi:hypothetical protein